MIEVEERGVGIYLVQLSYGECQLIEVYLSLMIDLDVTLQSVLFVPHQQTDHNAW